MLRARSKRRKNTAAADAEAATAVPLTTGATNFKLFFKLAAERALGADTSAKYRDDCEFRYYNMVYVYIYIYIYHGFFSCPYCIVIHLLL